MKKLALLILICVYLCGCEVEPSKKQEEKKVVNIAQLTPINNHKLIDSLINLAILKGNEKAYNEVASYYWLEERGEEFVYVALTVANKYNNPEAHFHVYQMLNSLRTGEKIENLDKKTRAFALYHLLKAYELGQDNAKYTVEEMFKDAKKIPKSSFYLNEYVQESNK